ncbi:MAG: hypothetical protein GXY38_08815 [Planctomycetes bacterium]|nr:hypothetical protein [Planctomycetota bacterium]
MFRTLIALMMTTGIALAVEPPATQPATAPATEQPPRRGGRPMVTPEQEQELLAWLKERRAEDFDRLTRLRDENPNVYRWAMNRSWNLYQHYKMLPPEIQQALDAQQKARVRSWRLSRAYISAQDEAQRQEIKTQLLASLGEEFDLEQKLREQRLEQMSEQLERLRAEMAERAAQRQALVEADMERLLKLDRPPGEVPPRQRGDGPPPPEPPRE